MDCAYIVSLALISIMVTVGLLFHHKYKHGDPSNQPPYTWSKGEYIQDPREQWFQPKDVGNCRSHECWVLMFATSALVCIIIYIVYAFSNSC